MNFAGIPPTTLYGGVLLLTTAPTATIEPLPIVVPDNSVTIAPIHTSDSMMTSLSYPSGLYVSITEEQNFPITEA